MHVNGLIKLKYINFGCRIMETAPTLPDFALALKVDEYQLPPVDASWNEGTTKNEQLSSNKLKE